MNPYESLFTDPIEEVECTICHDVMPIDEAHKVVDQTFVCDPNYYPECLHDWEYRESVRSEFYD